MTEIRNFLSNIKNKQGDRNLYDHLSNLLGKMLLENTDKGFDLFEEFSHDVKFSQFDYKKDTNFDHKARMRETYTDVKDWADKASVNLEVFSLSHSLCLNLSLQKLNVGTEEEPQEPGQCGYVPNLLEEMKKFEWAGIYFGEEETYHLQRSLTVRIFVKRFF